VLSAIFYKSIAINHDEHFVHDESGKSGEYAFNIYELKKE